MRVVPFVISTVITVGLVYCLNTRFGKTPAMGEFLSPQHGFWQNAEATDHDFNADLKLPGIKGTASVYFDDRLMLTEAAQKLGIRSFHHQNFETTKTILEGIRNKNKN